MSNICPSGTFFDDHAEVCRPCPNNTYNHGSKFFNLHQCYSIVDREILYVNNTSVKCAPGWTGKPIYHDGEYEEGCVDAEAPSFTPVWTPTFQPSQTFQPSHFIAPHRLPIPKFEGNNCTLVESCNTFCCISWLIFFGLMLLYSLSRSFIAFRQLREIDEDISLDAEEDEVSPTPMIAMVDIQEDDNVQLREHDSLRVAIPSSPKK